MTITAIFVALGVAVTAATGGAEGAEAYVVGGVISFIYQALLNRSVDSLPLGGAEVNGDQMMAPDVLGEQVLAVQASRKGYLSQMGGSSLVRLGLTGVLLVTAILAAQLWDGANLFALPDIELLGTSIAGDNTRESQEIIIIIHTENKKVRNSQPAICLPSALRCMHRVRMSRTYDEAPCFSPHAIT
jgi:hypothetical protein